MLFSSFLKDFIYTIKIKCNLFRQISYFFLRKQPIRLLNYYIYLELKQQSLLGLIFIQYALKIDFWGCNLPIDDSGDYRLINPAS